MLERLACYAAIFVLVITQLALVVGIFFFDSEKNYAPIMLCIIGLLLSGAGLYKMIRILANVKALLATRQMQKEIRNLRNR